MSHKLASDDRLSRWEYNAFTLQIIAKVRHEKTFVTNLPTKQEKNHTIKSPLMQRLLMVCMGNICRSPIAQTVVEKQAQVAGLARQLQIESAGTHAHHADVPDPYGNAAGFARVLNLCEAGGRGLIRS